MTPTYARLKREYDLGVHEALSSRKDTRGVTLVSARRGGQFVFKWVRTSAGKGGRAQGSAGLVNR